MKIPEGFRIVATGESKKGFLVYHILAPKYPAIIKSIDGENITIQIFIEDKFEFKDVVVFEEALLTELEQPKKIHYFPTVKRESNVKFKLVILTAMWKRHGVFSYFIEAIKRLKKDFEGMIDIECVTVGSEGEISKNLCTDNDIHYVEYENLPLGAKWNAGMSYAKILNPDYVIILGSDDLISNNYLELYLKYMTEGYDFIGATDCYVYDLITKDLVYWEGYKSGKREGEPMGMCRMLSKNLLKQITWQPWEDHLNNSLDYSMIKKIKEIDHKREIISMKEEGIFGVDLKSDVNMGSFDSFQKGEHLNPIETFSLYLPEQEISNILRYKKKMDA